MKRTVLVIILVMTMLSTCVMSVFAHDPFTWEVKQYNAAVAEAGVIKIDGECDDIYYTGTKIVSDDEECHDGEFFKRSQYYDDIADGTFEAYVAVDPTGMYIWVKVYDNTMFEVLDDNGNTGDYMQIYFDWVPAEQQHPTPEERYQIEGSTGMHTDKWDYKSYNSLGIAGMQYLGWISFDYTGVMSGARGFAPTESLGETGEEAIEYVTQKDSSGTFWTGEVFVPWREQEQKDAVAANKCFPCGIGFQCSDQIVINDEITESNEHNACIRFDQCRDYGLSYYWDYPCLADVVWGDGPINPDTKDNIIAIVATLVISGAGLAIICSRRHN